MDVVWWISISLLVGVLELNCLASPIQNGHDHGPEATLAESVKNSGRLSGEGRVDETLDSQAAKKLLQVRKYVVKGSVTEISSAIIV